MVYGDLAHAAPIASHQLSVNLSQGSQRNRRPDFPRNNDGNTSKAVGVPGGTFYPLGHLWEFLQDPKGRGR